MISTNVLRSAVAGAVAAVCATAGAVSAQSSCGVGLLGDVTGDGSVNVIDAQQIARWSVGLSVNATVESRMSTHGDVTGDGNVNVIDAQQVARWSVGLSTSFPVGEALPPCEGILVTTSTGGLDLDPNGYDLLLDGSFATTIGVNSAANFPDATPGGHSVTLEGLAANCGITNGSATRSVTVVEGEAVTVAYEVQCSPTAGEGTLEVQNETLGSGLPSSPYTVTVDGAFTEDMPVNGTVTISGLSLGSHQVTLGNVPGNCTVDGAATVSVDISSGQNVLNFAVNCSGEEQEPRP